LDTVCRSEFSPGRNGAASKAQRPRNPDSRSRSRWREAPDLKVRNVQAGSEQEVMVDGVLAGIGVHPNVELAQAAA